MKPLLLSLAILLLLLTLSCGGYFGWLCYQMQSFYGSRAPKDKSGKIFIAVAAVIVAVEVYAVWFAMRL